MVEQWTGELGAVGHSVQTLRLRRWQIGRWDRHLGNRAFDDATRDDVIALLSTLPSLSARSGMLSAVRQFYQWGRETGRLSADPTLGVRRPKQPRMAPSPIPDHLFSAALTAADDRVRAMLTLARFAGLRCCEIARAHKRNLIGPNLHIAGKGGHVDVIPAHSRVIDVYAGRSGYLFPSGSSRARGPHLLADAVQHIVNAHLRVYAPGWTMHKLRHAFITEVHAKTGDMFITQQLARHRSPATTAGYAKLSNQRLAEALARIDAGLAAA